jgi:hypothetical protein
VRSHSSSGLESALHATFNLVYGDSKHGQSSVGTADCRNEDEEKMKLFIWILAAVLTQVVAPDAEALQEFPVRARFIVGSVFINPTQINDVTTAQGLNKFDSLPHLGLEATTPLFNRFEGGLRFFKRNQRSNEEGSVISTNNHAEISQDTIQAVGRFALITSSIFRFDIFAGIGGANTSLKIKTAGIDGEVYNRASYEDGVGSFLTSYGASAALGYKWIYFMVEAGMEQNNISSVTRTGNAPSSIQEFDFSGNYLMIGLLLDGMRGTRD